MPKDFDCRGLLTSRVPPDYDAEKGKACLAAVEAETDPCGRLAAPGCAEVFNGGDSVIPAQAGKAAGESCTDVFECAFPSGGEAACRPAEPGGADVCVVLSRGALGDACAESCTEEGGGFSCVGPYPAPPGTELARCYRGDGLRCDSTSLTCVSLGEAGEACTQTTECVDGQVCGWEMGATAEPRKVCQAPRATGASCASPEMFADSEVCADGYCDESDLVCKGWVQAGGVCDPDSFVGVCDPQADCDPDTRTCTPQSDGGSGLVCGLIALAAGSF